MVSPRKAKKQSVKRLSLPRSTIAGSSRGAARSSGGGGGGGGMIIDSVGQTPLYVFNVMDYGAVANGDGAGGGTDNSTAFQNAMDAANAAGGGIVFIPHGMYRVDSCIEFHSNTHILGESLNILIFDGDYDGGVGIDATNNAYSSGGAGVFNTEDANGYNVSVQNLAILMPTMSGAKSPWYEGLCGIRFAGYTRGPYVNKVLTRRGHHGVMFTYSHRARIEKSVLGYGYTTNLGSLYPGNGLYLNQTLCTNSSNNNIRIQGASSSIIASYIHIDTPIIDECGGSSVYLKYCSDVTIRVNLIYTGSDAAITIINSEGIVIKDLKACRFGGGAVSTDIFNFDGDSRNIVLENVRALTGGGGTIVDNAPNTKYDLTLDGVHRLTVATNEYGGTVNRYTKTASTTLSGASADIQVNIPSGAKIINCALQVTTAITGSGATTWDAAYTGGSTQSIASAKAFTHNTKQTTIFDANAATNIASAETDIRVTPDAGTFTGGAIRAVVVYEVSSDLVDVESTTTTTTTTTT